MKLFVTRPHAGVSACRKTCLHCMLIPSMLRDGDLVYVAYVHVGD